MKNPVALMLLTLGSVAMVVATFLPLNESAAFGRIEQNTLIQHGGWALVALAIWIAAGSYYVDQGRQAAALVIVPCVLAAVLVGFSAITTGTQTLYPVGADGRPDANLAGSVSTPGIGIYVAGVGVVVAMAGALMLRNPSKSDSWHWNQRISQASDVSEPRLARCWFCGTPQQVPAGADEVECSNCKCAVHRGDE